MIAKIDKKLAKKLEPETTPWQNICYNVSQRQRQKFFKLFMPIVSLGKDELLIKTFGKPTFCVTYSHRNRVWALDVDGYTFMIYRSVRGTSVQVDPKTPKKVIQGFFELLNQEWNEEVTKFNKSLWGHKKRIIR